MSAEEEDFSRVHAGKVALRAGEEILSRLRHCARQHNDARGGRGGSKRRCECSVAGWQFDGDSERFAGVVDWKDHFNKVAKHAAAVLAAETDF